MKALYHSLRAQGLSIALRDHGKELFLSQPGTYYLRYSSTSPEFLTIEVKPPRTCRAPHFTLYPFGLRGGGGGTCLPRLGLT